MLPVEFETKISAGERPQTHALDRAATGTGNFHYLGWIISLFFSNLLPSIYPVIQALQSVCSETYLL
jgi:hypothetical protein